MFTTVLQDLFLEGYNKSCKSPTVNLWLANSLACLQSNSVSQDKDIPFKHLQSVLPQRKQDYVYILNALELWQFFNYVEPWQEDCCHLYVFVP